MQDVVDTGEEEGSVVAANAEVVDDLEWEDEAEELSTPSIVNSGEMLPEEP